MKKLALGALLVGLFAACGDEPGVKIIDSGTDAVSQCDPLAQTGCPAGKKCTWFVDALAPPQYIGHIGCAPDGTANVGEACSFGAPGESGFDDCKAGSVCGSFRGTVEGDEGVCKALCKTEGGAPSCDAEHRCVTYAALFTTGETTPPAAGVCDLSCDPMTDNDFDGSANSLVGPGSAKRTTRCSSDRLGCYGSPSRGLPPATGYSCTRDVNYEKGSANAGVGLRHRAQCTAGNECAAAGPTYFTNSCNQGYVPLLNESTEVSVRICVAMCKPLNCYMGNCGTSSANRLGAVGDACRVQDRVNASSGGLWESTGLGGGEHCRFLWLSEIDADGNFLRSQYSDTVGFCYNHNAYKYNADGDPNTGIGGFETELPPCDTLPDGVVAGSGFGAAELGCVDSMHAGLGSAAVGKTVKVPEAMQRKRATFDMPRALYHREMR